MKNQTTSDYKKRTSRPIKKNLLLFFALLCLIALLWKPLNTAINAVFVTTILQYVANDSWIVMSALIVLVLLYYITIFKQLKYDCVWSTRRVVTIEIIIIYLIFRFSGEYIYYGIGKTSPSYIDIICILIVISESTSSIIRVSVRKKQDDKPNPEYLPFYIDKPTQNDDLKRRNYANTLVEKIKSTFPKLPLEERKKKTNTSFTVLLSERYGQGKSSFFEQIKNIFESQKIDVIVFRPWLSNNPDHLIINYFDLLKDELGNYNKELRKLLQSYSVLASEHITGKAAKVVSGLLNEGAIEKQHGRISSILLEEGKLRIVLIDDVDRLQAEELLALIKLVRNTADFPYIAYVVAADKAAMKDTLKTVGIADPEEYIKKFFNFELLFPADDNNIIESLINNIGTVLREFGYSEEDIKELSLDINKNSDYYAPVFTNMRDVYRFCNILSFELDILKNQNDETSLLNDIYINDFVKLCIIQYLSPDLYKILRDYWYALLEMSNFERLSLKVGYEKYVNSRESIQSMLQATSKLNIDYEGNNQRPNTGEDKKDDDPKSLLEVLDKATPEKTELIKYLLVDLWQNTFGNMDLRRICFTSQYFIYFAGRYSKTEMSYGEALLLFSLKEESFVKEVSTIISHKKESLIHKLNIIVENRSIDRMSLLPNIIQLTIIDFKDYSSHQEPLLLSYFDYYKSQKYTHIIQSLYLQHKDEIIDNQRLVETHITFFKKCEQYAAGAFAICAMRPIYSDEDRRYISVFSEEQTNFFSKILIDNFYSKLFMNDPFGDKTIEAIPCIRMANSEYWNKLFVTYVRKMENPMECLFRLFYLYESKDGLYWNSAMVLAVFGEFPQMDTFDVLAEKLVGKELLEEYREGMNLINPNNTDFSTIEKINRKPFTKAAYEWWKSKSISS